MGTMELYKALEATFTSQNGDERRAAEEYIVNASKAPGAVKAFFEILVAEQVDLSVRTAAAIRCRSILWRRDWNAEDSPVQPEEKQLLHQKLIPALTTSPPEVQRQLADCLHRVVTYDFPQHWADLPQQLVATLTGDPKQIAGGLLALRKITKRYEMMGHGERREECERLAEMFFPHLLRLLKEVTAMAEVQTADVAHIQRLICKTFFSSHTNYGTRYLEHNPATAQEWMAALHDALKQPLDPSAPQAGWRVKKWVGYIISEFLLRSQRISGRVKKTKTGTFLKTVRKEYAKPFVETAMDIIVAFNPVDGSQRQRYSQVHDKAIARMVNILVHAQQSESLRKAMAPNLLPLLQRGLFAWTQFSWSDMQLWNDDPQEYMNRMWCTAQDDVANVHLWCLDLVRSLFIEPTVNVAEAQQYMLFLRNVLAETKDLTSFEQMARRYAAIEAIGVIRDRVVQMAADMVEDLVTGEVFPMIQSQFGFIRAKAIWTASRFANKIEWKNPQNKATLLHANLALLKDPDMPVRIEAATVLKRVLGMKGCTEEVRPIAGEIMGQLLHLMREIDTELVLQTLQIMTSVYGEDLAGESERIIQVLFAHFEKLTQGLEQSDIEDDEQAAQHMNTVAAADEAIKTIASFVMALEEKPEALMALQRPLVPMMEYLLQEKMYEFFEETTRLITTITSYAPRFIPELYKVFHRLLDCFSSFASHDLSESALAPLDNFVSKDCRDFLSAPERIQHLGQFCEHVLGHNNLTWTEKAVVPEVIEILIQHAKPCAELLRPALNNFYDIIFRTLAQDAGKPQTGPEAMGYVRILMINVVMNGLYFDVVQTLQYLEQRGVTAQFFQGMLDLSGKVLRHRDMKSMVLGLMAVLQYSVSNALPAGITDDMKARMVAAATRLTSLRAAMVKEEEADEEEDSEDDSEFGDVRPGFGSDDDDDDADDDAKHLDVDDLGDDEIKQQIMKARGDAVEGFEFDDFLMSAGDEGLVWSLIDEVNEAAMLKEFLAATPAAAQAVVAKLGEEGATYLQELEGVVQYGDHLAKKAKQLNEKKIA